MKYAAIEEVEYANGKGIGASLFVQGCNHHCKGCFNPETWDFNGGKEWNEDVEKKFLQLIESPFITRVSFLGGEPMEYPAELFYLINKVKSIRHDIKIWVWSGYTFEEISKSRERMKLLYCADVLVDGRYNEELRDLTLRWRGSSNQRVIDIQKTIVQNEIILYEE